MKLLPTIFLWLRREKLYTAISVVGGLLTIFVFVTGRVSLPEIFRESSTQKREKNDMSEGHQQTIRSSSHGASFPVDTVGRLDRMDSLLSVPVRVEGTENQSSANRVRLKPPAEDSQKSLLKIDTGAAGEKTSSATLFTSTSDESRKVEEQGFTFELTKCKRSSSTSLTCELIITNNEGARGLALHGKWDVDGCRFTDDSNDEYWAYQIVLNRQEGQYWVRDRLMPGSPNKAVINFRDIPAPVTRIILLNLAGKAGNAYWKAQFHNILISK